MWQLVLVYRGGVPYNAALFGDTPVWVHLWYTGHRDGNHPFQSFSFVVTKKGPPLGGVLPKLLGGFFDVLLQPINDYGGLGFGVWCWWFGILQFSSKRDYG